MSIFFLCENSGKVGRILNDIIPKANANQIQKGSRNIEKQTPTIYISGDKDFGIEVVRENMSHFFSLRRFWKKWKSERCISTPKPSNKSMNSLWKTLSVPSTCSLKED